MKIRVLIAAALLSFGCLAHADEASHSKAVEDLLDTMHAEKLLDGVKEQVFGQLTAQINAMLVKGSELNDTQRATVQRYGRKQIDLLGETLSWPKMKAFQISIYTQTYSEDEIREMIAFYKSPLGQKMLERQPKLTAVAMKEMQGQLQAMLPKLAELAKDLATELKSQATPAKK